MSFVIRRLSSHEHVLCEEILRALPEWFGIEQSILDYVRDIQKMETWVGADGEEDRGESRLDGFLTLRPSAPRSAEIQVMAIRREVHGRGLGRRLVQHAEQQLRARGVRYLQVKTLGPSRPDRHYAATRAFYERIGFEALEENSLWGTRNPCLMMVKFLGDDDRAARHDRP